MKTALYYLLLVGVPFLGLLAILRAGSRIVPPRSIGGVWEVQLSSPADGDCPGLVFEAGPAEMRISQSGPRASVTLSDRDRTSFSIDLEGDSLSGLLAPSEQRGCSRAADLHASVSSWADRDSIIGELRVAGCAECPVAQLRATRRHDADRP